MVESVKHESMMSESERRNYAIIVTCGRFTVDCTVYSSYCLHGFFFSFTLSCLP